VERSSCPRRKRYRVVEREQDRKPSLVVKEGMQERKSKHRRNPGRDKQKNPGPQGPA
jgi:hypothetical protein